MSITIQLDQGKRSCVLRIDGNFDVGLSSELIPASRNIPLSVQDVAVDLSNTASLDATAIANLVMFHSELSGNRTIRIVNCSEAVARVLTISGVSRLMPVSMKGLRAMDRDIIKTRNQDRPVNSDIS